MSGPDIRTLGLQTKEEKDHLDIRETRDRPSERTGLYTNLRDRQKGPNSMPNYETVRKSQTRSYNTRPSEETGLAI